MAKKKVLVDLSVLKYLNCGLGQVAYNYGRILQNVEDSDLEIHLLVPENFVGAFGNKVQYLPSNDMYKHFQFLMPRYDVWHAIHQLSSYFPFYKSTKYIITIHDLNFLYEKHEKRKQEKYLKKMHKKINRASKITTISNFSKEEIENNLQVGNHDIEVIYNGIERLSAKDEKCPEACKNQERPFLFTIGQVREKKNFHVLLDAMKQMPDYDLYIAGQDSFSYAEMIHQRVRDEQISNVHLLGEITHHEKMWLYNHCRAFVFPSLLEGFGLPIIEAMFFNKPVISSDKTSLKEIGGNHVYFLENFEPEHIKATIENGIESFYKNPDMAAQNMDYANSFSYEKHIARYLEIYKSL